MAWVPGCPGWTRCRLVQAWSVDYLYIGVSAVVTIAIADCTENRLVPIQAPFTIQETAFPFHPSWRFTYWLIGNNCGLKLFSSFHQFGIDVCSDRYILISTGKQSRLLTSGVNDHDRSKERSNLPCCCINHHAASRFCRNGLFGRFHRLDGRNH